MPTFFALASLLIAGTLYGLLRPVPATTSASRRGRVPRWTLILAVPAMTAALYAWTGRLDALSPAEADPARAMAEERTARLAARLGEGSVDVAGLRLLARSETELRRYAAAAAVHERLVALHPDDADELVDLAEALSLTQGGSYVGRPLELVGRALQHDDSHLRALAIGANAAADRGDLREAIVFWERMTRIVPDDTDVGRSVARNIVDAREAIDAGRKAAGP